MPFETPEDGDDTPMVAGNATGRRNTDTKPYMNRYDLGRLLQKLEREADDDSVPMLKQRGMEQVIERIQDEFNLD